jgi:murein DD-endopeptidase MepM/ murein hydrolase activator NlpD
VNRFAKGIPAIALVAAFLASALSGGGPDASPTAARADAQSVATTAPPPKPRPQAAAWRDCPLAIAPAGYVNPLASAIVNPERIDQGVDYAGVGKLVAIGAGRVTRVSTDNSGWPGTFIQYQLLGGADAGCYVYYAEGVVPAYGLHVGDTVSAGEPIATIIPSYPTGIELGWGAGIGTKAYAKVAGQWDPTDDADNIASAAGKSFSALIAALGGPPGKVEG